MNLTMPAAPLGAALGALFGCGLVLVLSRLPVLRHPPLDDRLAPYLREAPPSRLLTSRAVHGTAWTRMLAPVVLRGGAVIETLLGGGALLTSRLLRSGRPPDLTVFRAEQLAWGSVGAGVGIGVGAWSWARQGGGVFLPVAAVLIGGTLGIVGRDWFLTREIARRQARIMTEFPTVAELLALSVSAGEGAVAALERVSHRCRGELSAELRLALADTRSGAGLATALQGVTDRTELPGLARFVEGMIVALERGTPLADVLRAQAADAREEGRRHVMESAGRREISMMVPVVFLVLPVTVLFAVYPGLIALRLSP
ncbi:MAG: type II secretion system F family protein [Dermatophilaceae bacterium]